MSGKLSEAELAGARKKYVDAKTLPHELQAAKRIHLSKCDHMNDWWVGYGKDDSCQIEGSQNHWRWLAMLILGLADECDAPYSEQKDTPEFVEAMFAHVDALTAENERLTRDRDRAIRERVEAHALAKRLADDAIVALAGSKIATPEEGYLKAPQCLGDDIKRLREERDEVQQRLAALEFDPVKREELALGAWRIWYGAYFGTLPRCQFADISDAGKAGWLSIVDYLVPVVAASRDAEVAELQRQLDEATKRLAELTKPADEEELAMVAHEAGELSDYPNIVSFRTPWESLYEERKRRIRASSAAVAACVRAPLVQQIAELTEKLSAAERTAKAANDGREHAVRNQDRLAAELTTTKQALAAMTDERDRARDMLRQAEASSKATQQALADARGDAERVRAACEPFKAYAEEIPAAMPEDYVLVPHELTVKEWRELKAVIEAAPSPAPANPAASEPADSSHTPETAHTSSSQSEPAERRFVCPECGRSEIKLSDGPTVIHQEGCEWLLENERMHVWEGSQAEVEAAKGEGELKHGMNCSALGDVDDAECTCGLEWRKRLATEQEMHAAWRKRAEEAEQQLAADRQAREAAAERWQAKVLELERRCNDEHFKCEAAEQRAAAAEGREAALQSKLNDLEASRKVLKRDAEAAEAAVDALKETIKRVCFVGPADGRICSSCGSCYSPHSPQCEVGKALADPGRAADELRALREIAEKAKAVRESFDNLIRGKLVSAEALAEHSLAHTQLRAAVSDYDEAVAQGEQRGEGR